MNRGIVMFGLNNETMDYVKLCVINAKLIKKNMGDIPITIITSEYSLTWDWPAEHIEEIKELVDLIILPDAAGLFDPKISSNKRIFRNTQYYSKKDVFLNNNRVDAYELSPYDETLLIDCDYLILSDSLNGVWGNVEDFMLSRDVQHLHHGPMDYTEWRLNPYGIKTYFASIIYFKKTERVKTLFELVSHVKSNWKFYSLSYDFPSGLYRNDFAFSIAIHMLSGFQENDDFKPIPDVPMIISLDKDQLIEFVNSKEIITYVKNLTDTWSFSLQRIKGINVHIMNKIALLDNADKIFEVLDNE